VGDALGRAYGALVGFIPCAYRIHGCSLPLRTCSKPASRTIRSSRWTGLFCVAGLVKDRLDGGRFSWWAAGSRQLALGTRGGARAPSRGAPGGAAYPVGD